ncbi:transposase [Sinorhizobium meliloti]|uniref:transposase n=1 Tax=Rhizobium meliloti TaxID=382 RepID=UPI003CC5B167
MQELRWLYDRRDLDEAKADLAAWLGKWSVRYPRLTSWVEETIEQTLTFFRLPRQHHKHLKSTNMLERLNEEIRRRTFACASFPIPRAAYASSARSPSKPTKTGWRPIATSTWTTCESTRNSHSVKPHDQHA